MLVSGERDVAEEFKQQAVYKSTLDYERVIYQIECNPKSFTNNFANFSKFLSKPTWDNDMATMIQNVKNEQNRWAPLSFRLHSFFPNTCQLGKPLDGLKQEKTDLDELKRLAIDHHTRHYTGKRINCVVLAPKGAVESPSLIIDKIQESFVPGEEIITEPTPFPNASKMMYYAAPDTSPKQFTISFPYPAELLPTGAPQYLINMLNHQSEGSLFTQAWAGFQAQVTGIHMSLCDEMNYLSISCSYDDKANSVNSVIAAVFEYLDKLRKLPIDQGLYNEFMSISQRDELLFGGRDMVNTMAMDLKVNPETSGLGYPFLRHQLTQDDLDSLFKGITWENAMITIEEPQKPVEYTQYGDYQFYYHMQEKKDLEASPVTYKDLSFKPAPILPGDWKPIGVSDIHPTPAQVYVDDTLKAWRYSFPTKTSDLVVQLCGSNFTKYGNSTSNKAIALEILLSDIFSKVLVSQIQQLVPLFAVTVGSVEMDHSGLSISVRGQDDMLLHLLPNIIWTIGEFMKQQLSTQEFEYIRSQAAQGFDKQTDVYKQLTDQLVLIDSYTTSRFDVDRIDNLSEVINSVTHEELSDYVKDLWEEICLQVLFMGNFKEGQCSDAIQQARGIPIPAKPYADIHSVIQTERKRQDEVAKYRVKPNGEIKTNGALVMYDFGDNSITLEAHARLLAVILGFMGQQTCEKQYPQFTWKHAWFHNTVYSTGIAIAVESETMPAEEIVHFVDALVDTGKQAIQNIESQGVLADIKKRQLEAEKHMDTFSLDALMRNVKQEILNHRFDFDRNAKKYEELEKIQMPKVEELWDRISKGQCRRVEILADNAANQS